MQPEHDAHFLPDDGIWLPVSASRGIPPMPVDVSRRTDLLQNSRFPSPRTCNRSADHLLLTNIIVRLRSSPAVDLLRARGTALFPRSSGMLSLYVTCYRPGAQSARLGSSCDPDYLLRVQLLPTTSNDPLKNLAQFDPVCPSSLLGARRLVLTSSHRQRRGRKPRPRR